MHRIVVYTQGIALACRGTKIKEICLNEKVSCFDLVPGHGPEPGRLRRLRKRLRFVTEDRLLVMDFSDSYATGIQVVIVPEGSDVTLDNLGEQLIGTQRATTGNIYCTDDYGEDHVIAYDDGIVAVQDLLNGKVDAVVIDKAPAQEFVAANPGLVILDTEYANEDYAIGVAKGNTALVDAVNGALAELTADGTIQSIIEKYIPAEG